MITLRTLSAADYADYLDFIDLVFSQAHRPHDFRQLLPKLYRPTDEAMGCHTALFENGRIQASAGLYPVTLMIGRQTLPAAGIGAVSTHARASGKGYMRRVMESLIDTAKERGYALLFLGGERLRYNRYGFESAGKQYSLAFSAKRLSAFSGQAASVTLVPWDENDPAPLSLMQNTNRARLIHAERADSDVYDILRSWNCRTDLALRENGVTGYISYQPQNGSIQEAGALSAEDLLGLLCAHSRRFSDFTWHLPEWPAGLSGQLLTWADSTDVGSCCLWRILDYPLTTRTLLQTCPPPSGTLAAGIGNEGVLVIRSEHGTVDAFWDGSAVPDIQTDPLTYTRLLLGHLMPDDILGSCPEAEKLSGWFPRPIGIFRPDEV